MQSVTDDAFAMAVVEVSNILALRPPSDEPIAVFGAYAEPIKWLRDDYTSDPANIESTWNQIKTFTTFAGLVAAIDQGWNDHPDRDLLSLPKILEVVTTAGDENATRQTVLNITRDAAALSAIELLQLTEVLVNRLNIPRSWVAEWKKAVAEARQTQPAANQPQTPPTAPPVYQQPSGTPQFNLTDLGNAKRLASSHGRDMHYIHSASSGRWLVWNGIRWSFDNTGEVSRRAKLAVLDIYREAAHCVDDNQRRETTKWAHASESADRIAAMMKLAQSEPGIPVTSDDLDRDPMLFNCSNGTVDLTTGQLKSHSRSDLITNCSSVIYDPSATCPIWLSFLDSIMESNQDLVNFLKRAVGYSLTGLVDEQCFFFMYGVGKNGKSTFSLVVSRLLGSYAKKIATETVMAKKHQQNTLNDTAALFGARFVLMSEVEAGSRLSEAHVKDITGGDELSGRYLYQERFTFMPTHKLWMYGNYRPVIRGSDPGIWSRIRLIPFTKYFPPEQRLSKMPEILTMELSGILNWALEGCLEWQKDRLGTPDTITDAVSSYRELMDIIGAYINENTITDVTAKVSIRELYENYALWCVDNGENALDQRSFSQRISERGFQRSRSTGGLHVFIGIGLRH